MKQVMTTPDMVKAKIKYLEKEMQRATNRVNDSREKIGRSFDELSKVWLSFYMDLNAVSSEMDRGEYQFYLKKLYSLRDDLTHFAILLEKRKSR